MFYFYADEASGIEGTVTSYIDKGLDFVTSFLHSMPWYVQALIILAVALLLIIGIFALIKKCWKLFLILAILAGVGFAVYKFVILPKMGGDTTTTTAAINLISNLRMLL